MKNVFTMSLRGSRTVGIHNASTGQLSRVLTVDGDVVGTPNVSGTTGIINAKKGSTNKTYVYDLPSGKLINTFNT